MWHAYANSHSNSYAYANGDTNGYAYTDSDTHGDALSDADVRGGRYSWSVDTGSAGGDRSLRRLHGQRWDVCL